MSIEEDKIYSAEVLNENLEIPFRYLRKQLTKLSNNGLLTSYRGKSGGYMLSRPAKEITLWDIIEITEDTDHTHQCIFGFEDCAFGQRCAIHYKWEKIQDAINEMLKNTTLEELKRIGPQRFISQHNLMLTKNV